MGYSLRVEGLPAFGLLGRDHAVAPPRGGGLARAREALGATLANLHTMGCMTVKWASCGDHEATTKIVLKRKSHIDAPCVMGASRYPWHGCTMSYNTMTAPTPGVSKQPSSVQTSSPEAWQTPMYGGLSCHVVVVVVVFGMNHHNFTEQSFGTSRAVQPDRDDRIAL